MCNKAHILDLIVTFDQEVLGQKGRGKWSWFIISKPGALVRESIDSGSVPNL